MNVIPLNMSTSKLVELQTWRRSTPDLRPTSMAFNTREGLYITPVKSIVHCMAMDNYSQVFLQDGTTITMAKTLKALEADLAKHGFVRIHQSHIVALQEINFVGHESLKLTNGKEIPIARGKRKWIIGQVLERVR